jgi:hypothetical protein
MDEVEWVSGAETNELHSVNILYENFIVAQLVKQFSAFYGTRRFVTLHHRILSESQ